MCDRSIQVMHLGREIVQENSDSEKNVVIPVNHLEVNFYCSALGEGQMLSFFIFKDKQVGCTSIIHCECKV